MADGLFIAPAYVSVRLLVRYCVNATRWWMCAMCDCTVVAVRQDVVFA